MSYMHVYVPRILGNLEIALRNLWITPTLKLYSGHQSQPKYGEFHYVHIRK